MRAKAAFYLGLAAFCAVIAAIWAVLALREGQFGLQAAAAVVWTIAAAAGAAKTIAYFKGGWTGRKQ
jgi:hypothetical protein